MAVLIKPDAFIYMSNLISVCNAENTRL